MKYKTRSPNAFRLGQRAEATSSEEKPLAPDNDPAEMPVESDELSDLDETSLPVPDDNRWDVFIIDDNDREPLPELGDFWLPD